MQGFLYIQYLRAVAAILVVIHHILSPNPYFASPVPSEDYGTAGVYLFFVVSGFIICVACGGESAASFIARRAIRVIPLYWIFTTAKFVIINIGHQASATDPVFLKEYVLSMLFIPHENYLDPSMSFPILYQGWSLNVEIGFYLIFAVGILLRRPLLTTCMVIAMLVGIGLVLEPSGSVLATFTQPYLALFLAGLIVGLIHERIRVRPDQLFAIGLVGLLACSTVADILQHGALLMGIAAVVTVLGAAGMGRGVEPAPKLKPLERIGDASYALYLSHTFVFPTAVASAFHISSATSIGIWYFLPIVLALCVSVSIAVNVFLERPLLALLQDAFGLQLRSRGEASLATVKAGAS